MSYIGSLDQGTTSTRFMIFDHSGRVIGQHQLEHRQILPEPGWVEHDPMEIWHRTQEVISGALAQAGIIGSDLTAIGITNQRETVVAWDVTTGAPLYNAIVWQDTRTQSILDQLTDSEKSYITHTSGLTIAPYFSGSKMRWLLENEWLERVIGYSLITFQFLFLPLLWFRWARVPLLLIGVSFHIGIILSLNIYQFGFGMLAPYALLVPISWWKVLRLQSARLTIYYDGLCPLCNRTVIILSHFDLLNAIAFKDLQTHAKSCRALDFIPEAQLLKDLYAVDRQGWLFAGVDAYAQILSAMVYPAPLAWIVWLPGINQIAKLVYRRIADNRTRFLCNESCAPLAVNSQDEFWVQFSSQYVGTPRRQATRIAKFLLLVALLQLNSTLQFGVFYRINKGHATTELGQVLEGASNSILFLSHTFLGITPHALYMHDHFAGYNHLLAVAYKDTEGQEHFLPFVNEEGRIVAPNWGRVQCWWANIAVTPHIKRQRLNKALMQVTAFWGEKAGLDVRNTVFLLKMKEVRVPMDWEPNLREYNLRQPWRDIGTVIWDDVGHVVVDTPGIDLEAL